MGRKHKQFDNCDNCGKHDYLVNVSDRVKDNNDDEDWCDDCIEKEQERIAKKENKLEKAYKTIKKFMERENMTFKEVEEYFESEESSSNE
jgi:hypothetical protein